MSGDSPGQMPLRARRDGGVRWPPSPPVLDQEQVAYYPETASARNRRARRTVETKEVQALLDDIEPEQGVRREKLEKIVNLLRSIANYDARDLVGEDGAMVSAKQWPDGLALAVSSFSMAHAGGYNVRFYDKLKAADLLTKYESLLVEEDEQTSPLHAAFEKIPRDRLIAMKLRLDTLARDRADVLEAQSLAEVEAEAAEANA